MIQKVLVGLAHNPDWLGENAEKMSKQTAEALAAINDYLNDGGRILAKERQETALGSTLVFILWKRDREEGQESP